jgi:hypothetical protein
MVVLIGALLFWWVLGWKFAVMFAAGGLLEALVHDCAQSQRDHAHVQSVLCEQRKREGFLRHS